MVIKIKLIVVEYRVLIISPPDHVVLREKGPLNEQWGKEVSEKLTAGNNTKALLDSNENTETSKHTISGL